MSLIIRVTSVDNSKTFTRRLEGADRIEIPRDAKIAIVDEATGEIVPVKPKAIVNDAGEQMLVARFEAEGEEVEIALVEAQVWPVDTIVATNEGLEALAAAEPLPIEELTREGSSFDIGEAVGGIGTLGWVLLGVIAAGGIAVALSDDDDDEDEDITPPTAPTNLDLDAADDNGTSNQDDIVSEGDNLTINGNAEAGSAVELFAAGASLGTVTADAGGEFSIDVTLPEGANEVTATSTDAAGNVSAASAALTITVDNTTPAAPVLDLPAEFDTGTASDDNITDLNDVSIVGTAEAGSTIELFRDGVSQGTTLAAGDGSFGFAQSLANGDHSFTATATDAAGLTSPVSGALDITVGQPPQALNASIDGAGTVVTVYFDEQLDPGSVPATDQLAITDDGGTDLANVTRVIFNGTRATLYLDQPISDADGAFLNFTAAPGTVTDLAGNAAESGAGIALTNDTSPEASNAISFGQRNTIALDGAEIVAFDPESDRFFVTSGDGLQVIEVDEYLNFTLLGTVDVGSNDITSVAVSNGLVAVAVAAETKTDNGSVFFLDADADVGPGMVTGEVEVGALPDMVAFTPDGQTVLTANEGERTELDDVEGGVPFADPEGSVSVIDISGGVGSATVRTAGFTAFNDKLAELAAEGVRLFAGTPGNEDITVAQDVEPEYIAVSPDGTKALVTLQEANAVAILDIASATITDIQPLGLKPFDELLFDLSDRDGGINLGETPAPANAETSMMKGENGFWAQDFFTIGQTISDTSGALNASTAGDYTPVGVLDGLGAYELDDDTVRVFANHELLHFRGNEYTVGEGDDAFTLTGARISYFDIDKETMQIVDGGIAYDTIYDALGNVATDDSFTSLPDFGGFSRFCSAVLFENDTFGDGNGLVDTIYFAGEEDGGFFNPVGGAEWALDVASGEIWQIPMMGRGAWENITQLDTGTTSHVAFILSDDSSPFNFDDDPEDEAAPLYLYVGKKDTADDADFLSRNGLSDGDLYVWVASAPGVDSPEEFTGAGSSQAGDWVLVDNSRNEAMASDDGSTGFDQFGYPTQGNLWNQAEAAGAFQFSRPEDVATNPHNGSEFVLASTGVDTFDNQSDQWGEIYTMDVEFSFADGEFVGATGTMNVLYDGDEDPTRALRSPDNLDWADDGKIYVQEDEAEEDTFDGSEVFFGEGAANPKEAGIVALDPTVVGGDPVRVGTIDRSVLPDGAVDADAGAAGEWESSGILDVSELFDRPAGSLFIGNVQAHGIEDQLDNGVTEGPASRINDNDLVEGGQLFYLYNEDAVADRANVFGQFMPDTIASYTGADGETYYVIANEGDARDDFFEDVDGRGDDLNLDPDVFPNADFIQSDDQLGRLEVTLQEGLNGDTDGDGDIDQILAYGGRSFSILNAQGVIVYDSGSVIEEFAASLGEFIGDDFPDTGVLNDSRSDAKGPEPEAITTGVFGDRVLAFVGLERGGGGVMVFDVTHPGDVSFVSYIREASTLAPEGLVYIPAEDSPTGRVVLAVATEGDDPIDDDVGMGLTVFEIAPEDTYTLQLLHFADGEAKSLAIETAPNLAALVDAFEDDYNNSITLSGGDNFIPGLFFTAQNDDLVEGALGFSGGPKVDIAIHNAIGVQASTVGNHEFDRGTGTFASAIAASGAYDGALFPYLSANLDFAGDGALSGLFTETLGGGLDFADQLTNAIVPSAVIEENGELIGLVGATTQVLDVLTSTGGVDVKGTTENDMELLAAQLQPYIDDLILQGVNKIIVMSHLQQIALEQALAPLLEGVDIILAAGSNTRLSDDTDELVAFTGHPATSQGDYPILTAGVDGKPTLIVNTDNEFTYLGRLVVDFDANGEIILDSLDENVNGAYAATAEIVAQAWNTEVANLDETAFADGTRGAEVQFLVDAVNSVLATQGSNVFGFSDVFLEGARVPGVRTEETNLGNLTADANADAAREAAGLTPDDVVVSFKNGGGIRDSIGSLTGVGSDVVQGPNEGGVITELDVGAVLAFNNGLIAFDTTPQGLLNILNSPNVFEPANGGFGQVSGLEVSYDPDAPQGDRVVDVALVDGNGNKTALVDDGVVVSGAPASIKMVTLDFIAGNDGDGTQIAENGSNFRYIVVNGDGSYALSDELGTLDTGGGNLVVNTGAFAGDNDLGEQQALAEYLGEFHGTLETAFDEEDTPQELDERIQNIDIRDDTVLDSIAPLTTLVLEESFA